MLFCVYQCISILFSKKFYFRFFFLPIILDNKILPNTHFLTFAKFFDKTDLHKMKKKYKIYNLLQQFDKFAVFFPLYLMKYAVLNCWLYNSSQIIKAAEKHKIFHLLPLICFFYSFIFFEIHIFFHKVAICGFFSKQTLLLKFIS